MEDKKEKRKKKEKSEKESPLNLVGNHIDTQKGAWTLQEAGMIFTFYITSV